MTTVVLINPFEVPPENEEEFLKGWVAARDFMQRQKGYVATRLHRSLDPTARFRFSTWRNGNRRQTFRPPCTTQSLCSCEMPRPLSITPRFMK